MSQTQTTPATSFSKALAGTTEALFPAAPNGSFIERIIGNPNATNSVWVNLAGGAAAANGLDCVEIKPGEELMGIGISSAINVIGTAADKVTAIQR